MLMLIELACFDMNILLKLCLQLENIARSLSPFLSLVVCIVVVMPLLLWHWSYCWKVAMELLHNKNVGQCPTWWLPCRIYVAPSVQRRRVWLTSNTGMLCSNAAKTRNPLKFARVPQTQQQISAARGPKFTILWGHVEEILLLNSFLQRAAMLTLQALYKLRQFRPSVCPSVRLSVTPVLCQNDGT